MAIRFKHILVQGRVLPQIENTMQYFPDNWKDEFPLINRLGFSGIEWIYDVKSELTNPILSNVGRKQMLEYSKMYNVNLENIVFDWFLINPFLVGDSYTIQKKIEKMEKLIELSSQTGFKRIIFPLLEQNAIESSESQKKFIQIFNDKILKCLDANNIELHLETSLHPQVELELCKKLNHDKIKICFDMGNSASEGYEPKMAINTIAKFLGSVHIKDRKFHGSSTPLNDGNVNFHKVFRSLLNINFHGPLSYQIYRNKNSDNIAILQNSLIFINKVIDEVSVD